MRSAVTPWSIGAASLVGEITMCAYLTMTMWPSYGRGEGVFLLSVIPTVLMLFYCYHLWHYSGQWSSDTVPQLRYKSAVTWQLVGAICSLGGLWLAIGGGPHVAPFFVLWGLLLQLGAIWVARRALTPRIANGGSNSSV